MRTVKTLALAIFVSGLWFAAPASAQPLGSFRWQLQPYCNIITVAVVQQGGQYQLDGTDDQCGAAVKASVVGLAFQNPNGSIGFGLTIVTAPGGQPVHVDATISISTLSGTWQDSAGHSGTFIFTPGAGTGGGARPLPTTTPDVRFRVNDMPSSQVVTSVAALTNWSATPAYNVGGGTYTPASGSYTVPVTGLYLLNATVRWQAFASAVAGSYKCAFFFANASTRLGNTCDLPTNASFQIQVITTVTPLTAGDVITVRAFQNSGATGTVGTASSSDATWSITLLR